MSELLSNCYSVLLTTGLISLHFVWPSIQALCALGPTVNGCCFLLAADPNNFPFILSHRKSSVSVGLICQLSFHKGEQMPLANVPYVDDWGSFITCPNIWLTSMPVLCQLCQLATEFLLAFIGKLAQEFNYLDSIEDRRRNKCHSVVWCCKVCLSIL